MLLFVFSFADKAVIIYLLCCVIFLIIRFFYCESRNDAITPYKLYQYRMNCSKIEFVRAVIRWCMKNLDQDKKKIIYLKLKYYKHKKLMGSYNYLTKTITIYFDSHTNVESLVDTIIHEYFHSMEIQLKKDQTEYDKLSLEKSYYNNPFEVRARAAGKNNRSKCILYLYKSNYLVRC